MANAAWYLSHTGQHCFILISQIYTRANYTNNQKGDHSNSLRLARENDHQVSGVVGTGFEAEKRSSIK